MSILDIPVDRRATELNVKYLPHLSINGVIFGLPGPGERETRLHVLIAKFMSESPSGLPVAYVPRELSLDETASRTFSELLGVQSLPLAEVGAFGAPDRVSDPDFVAALSRLLEMSPDHWIFGRVVSIAYAALVRIEETRIHLSAGMQSHQWIPVGDIPELMLDHAEMVDRACAYLRRNLSTLPLGSFFPDGEFTMPQLQTLYETVLDQPLDRRNFQKQMLDSGLVTRLDRQVSGGQGRPAWLYRWAGN